MQNLRKIVFKDVPAIEVTFKLNSTLHRGWLSPLGHEINVIYNGIILCNCIIYLAALADKLCGVVLAWRAGLQLQNKCSIISAL